MPNPLNADHPARGIPPLADGVSAIDNAINPARWHGSPAVAHRVALDAAHRAYVAGRHAAIRELVTTEQAAAVLDITPPQVRRIAAKLGVGWHLERTVWLFTPDDLAAMAARKRTPGPARRSRDDGA